MEKGSRLLIESLWAKLSDKPVVIGSVPLQGVRTRLERLLKDLGELNINNSVALWTRYYRDKHPLFASGNHKPASLEIDLTTYCDSGCFFCKEGRDKLEFEYPFEKLVADLTSLALLPDKPLIIFSGGGEPTAYRRFAEAMRCAHNLGFETYVSTHGGTIGTPEVPREVFTECATILKVSIGAADHRTYNKVHNRGQAIPQGDIRTVDYVLEQCRRISLNRRSVISLGEVVKLPRILIAMTVSPINQGEVLLMTQKAVEAGADTLLFRPIITSHRQLLEIDVGLTQMQEARLRYGDQIEILTFNHRIDYGYQREDYFDRCISHPVVSPDGASDGSGTVTPCIFRRGNRAENGWITISGAKTTPLRDLIQSPAYQKVALEQDRNLHEPGLKRCPRCRKVSLNIFTDILRQASEQEREIICEIVLLLYPRNPLGEIIKGLH